MHRELKNRFRKLGVIAVPVATAAILVGSALPAMANVGTDGFTVLGAYEGQAAHTCEVIGVAHKGYEGVVCVDITSGTTSGDYWSQGDIEVYCQTTAGAEVPCEDIEAYGVFADGSGDVYSDGGWICGPDYEGDDCPGQRETLSEGTIGYNYAPAASDCWQYPNSSYDVWTVAYGNDVKIQLPVSGDTVTLPSNFETGHYYVCPYSWDGD